MIKNEKFSRAPLVLAIATASTFTPQVWAQVEMDDVSSPPAQQIEEVMVQGRLLDSAERLVNERLEEEVVTDVLGSEMIGRVGDSTVAAALRRVSGLSLVDDKFVYVRGLGERYSSSSLNGSVVPSPDLTRNVLPLDIFPTSVVDSLSVQKTYSADKAATFGGGNVDIRTKGIPEQLTYSLELGTGFNSETGGEALSYQGGGDDEFGTDDGTRAMPTELQGALDRFKGRLDVGSIRSTLITEGMSPEEASAESESLNRQLASSLNRDIAVDQESVDPQYDMKASVGNKFYLTDNWEVGFLAGGSYKSEWQENERISRSFTQPEEVFGNRRESTYSVDISGNLNIGVSYAGEHSLDTTTLYLRNTDDETAVRDFYNADFSLSDGRGYRNYSLRFEERDLMVNQVKGSHSFGAATKDLLPMLSWVPEEFTIDWRYSDSKATTDIPNEVRVNAVTETDTTTGEVISSRVEDGSNSSANYRFTDMEDNVIDYGWEATLPLAFSSSTLELSGGYSHTEKGRIFKESRFAIGISDVADDSILEGPLDEVFGDESLLDASNDYSFSRSSVDNKSYIAATMTDAVFGKADWTFQDTWRVSAGARWEDYNQVALDWNPYGYSIDDPQVTTDPEELEEATFIEDNVYPSLSITYMGSLWAETFQLRFGASETTVRPDLREITEATYLDPVTGERITGNSNVRPAEISNLDLRAEWFFANGDNLTVSAFYKDITAPIEFFQRATSDTDIGREILNAESGEVSGVEFEGLKNMGFLGETMDSFFVQGNLTLQDSEIVAGQNASAPTNPERPMAGASEYVVNMLMGFDSPDGSHSATLGYNVFGERLYLAGRNGEPDAFEQPFHSLDLTYSWYPTEEVTVKAKMQNLLDEAVEIERSDVAVFEEKPGQTFSLSAQYQF